MSAKREAELVSSLPKDLAKALGPALKPKASPKAASKAFVKVLQALEYPVDDTFSIGRLIELTDRRWRGVMLLPSELTAEQRAVAELLAHRDGIELFYSDDGDWQKFRMPETAANRRRWLGLDPPGPLEADVTFVLKKKKSTEPAWHALQRAVTLGVEGAKEAFASLSVADRLRVLGGLVPTAYGLEDVLDWLSDIWTPEGIGKEHAAWAREQAERLLALPAREGRRLRFVVFPALVRAKVPIDERFETLLPFELNPNLRNSYDGIIRECLAAIPDDRRERAVMASLAKETPADRAAISWSMLEDLPYRGVAEIALAAATAQSLPKMLERLERLGEAHAAIRDVLSAYREKRSKKAKVPALECGPTFEPASASELTPMQRKQLEAFGKAYDGQALSAKDRLSPTGGVDDGTFKGFLEIVGIVEKGKGRLAYDAFLMIDSGSIFVAGTTEEIGAFIQGSLDECRDPELFEALEKAFAARRKAAKTDKKKPVKKTTKSKKKSS
jgi:hypothetical protein